MRKPDAVALDRHDREILRRWQRDTQQPAKMIADAIGLSTAAVQRRLKRLREAGVIEREIAQLRPDAFGIGVTCIVAVDLDRERDDDLARFRRRMAALPQVQQCYYVTGSADFMLVVLAADMAAYEAFTRHALLADDNVKSFTTHVVLDRVKASLAVPFAEDDEANTRGG